MKRRYIIGLIGLIGLMVACEKRIDIDIEDQQQKVVVKSDNDADENVSVTLSLSRPVYGTFYVRDGEDYFPKVTNATATLGVNGVQLSATREGNVYTFSHQPQPGEELTLSVEVPGHETATATATVPNMPTVENVVIDTADSYYGSLRFTLVDNGTTDDYYSVRVRITDTIVAIHYDSTATETYRDTNISDGRYGFYSCTDYLLINNTDLDNIIDPEDPDATATYYGTRLLFSDANINGQRHTIKIDNLHGYYDYDWYYAHKDDGYEYVEYEIHQSVVLEVSSLTRDLYLYNQTVEAYDDDELLNFFSEPVQIHSNISGGIGIFGVQSVYKQQLQYRWSRF